MKILLVSDATLSKELGASKVVMELAQELVSLGWECRVSSIPELVGRPPNEEEGPAALRSFLRVHASEYDVIDFGHYFLPFPRSEFSATTLLVARSVLLVHHFKEIGLPLYPGLKARLHGLIFAARNRRQYGRTLHRANITMTEADLVNVANSDDQSILVRYGIPKDKIVVLPYGIGREREAVFERSPHTAPASSPTVAYVGTFDGRKGARDFPRILRYIASRVPEVRFRLLGTYKEEHEVLSRLPKTLTDRIQVVPRYPADSLPELLAGCSLGIFPSYIEGFGFGVLEMLAAGLPVVAYNVPGPPMMLSERFLVPIGDAVGMGEKAVRLLKSPADLAEARTWANQRWRHFLWSDIARRTSEIYTERWEQLDRGNRANSKRSTHPH